MAARPGRRSAAQIGDQAATAMRPVEVHKAWREQVHRMLAGTLGRAGAGAGAARRAPAPLRHRHHRDRRGLVALSIALYIGAAYVAAAALAAHRRSDPAGRGAALVERRLRARVGAHAGGDHVPGAARHVDGDLAAQAARGDGPPAGRPDDVRAAGLDGVARDRPAAAAAGCTAAAPAADRRPRVAGLQIALGGWTSSNYAALACGTDFPTCVGRWWPPHDFREGVRALARHRRGLRRRRARRRRRASRSSSRIA